MYRAGYLPHVVGFPIPVSGHPTERTDVTRIEHGTPRRRANGASRLPVEVVAPVSEPSGPTSTVLVVDHRHTTSTGWPGETILDCCRSAALDVLGDCRGRSAPVGLVTVGDDGITGWEAPSATERRYATVEDRLRELQPTVPAEASDVAPGPDPGSTSAPAMDRKRATWALRGDESAFATTVRAFLDSPVDYHRHIGADQLPEAVQFTTRRLSDRLSVILVAGDSRPGELRNAVEVAGSGFGRVVAYLAPRALFEPRDLADAEETYRGYREFDRLRRELESKRRVDVHEVAPV